MIPTLTIPNSSKYWISSWIVHVINIMSPIYQIEEWCDLLVCRSFELWAGQGSGPSDPRFLMNLLSTRMRLGRIEQLDWGTVLRARELKPPCRSSPAKAVCSAPLILLSSVSSKRQTSSRIIMIMMRMRSMEIEGMWYSGFCVERDSTHLLFTRPTFDHSLGSSELLQLKGPLSFLA
jgi:hypothetical protein